MVLAILVTVMWTARNAVRHSHHNRFEAIHRYGGWTALVILVALVVRHVARTMPSDASIVDIVRPPSVLLLLVLVALVVHPWLGVRRVACEVKEHRPESAPFIVSNAHVGDEAARVCERLDVPWYGPTFDS